MLHRGECTLQTLLSRIFTAPQNATALHTTETLHKAAGGPQIIQYLSENKEEQPEGGRTDRRGQTGSELVHHRLH